MARSAVPAAQQAQRQARTRWRELQRDGELPLLVVRAQHDAVVARASLECLLERCRPLAWQIARTYVTSEADGADIVQEASLQTAHHLRQLRRPDAFPHWFAAIVHNAARQWLRREREHRRVEALADDDDLTGEISALADRSAGSDFSQMETQDALARLLPALTERERQALLGCYLAGQSHLEIGRRLGLTARAVEGLLYRSMRRLRSVLAQCENDVTELESWCNVCGSHRLQGRIQPGLSPHYPLHLQATCPSCRPGNLFWVSLPLPLRTYDSLDAALQRGGDVLNSAACRLLSQPASSCERCRAPLRHRRFWDQYGYQLQWYCPNCRDGGVQAAAFAVAARLPAWRSFWQSPQHVLVQSHSVQQQGGERRLFVDVRDVDSGRHARLTLAFDSLQVRCLEVSGQ